MQTPHRADLLSFLTTHNPRSTYISLKHKLYGIKYFCSCRCLVGKHPMTYELRLPWYELKDLTDAQIEDLICYVVLRTVKDQATNEISESAIQENKLEIDLTNPHIDLTLLNTIIHEMVILQKINEGDEYVREEERRRIESIKYKQEKEKTWARERQEALNELWFPSDMSYLPSTFWTES